IQKNIESKLFKGKAIIIYGPRQIGKTTLLKSIMEKYQDIALYLNCDEPDIRKNFEKQSSTKMKSVLWDKKLIIFDEVQRIRNAGLTLKLLVDNYPEIQIIATGSSALDLSEEISEPMTGRVYEYTLYPLSITELMQRYNPMEFNRMLPSFLRFGTYPNILNTSELEAPEKINNLANKYLYQDILEFEHLKKHELIIKLLEVLALRIGQEISYDELAATLEVNKNTIIRYVNLLERVFVIKVITPFARSYDKEVTKMRKIYFYDLGIRNSLIRNFNDLDLRMDNEALWENFCVMERIKLNSYNAIEPNYHYWRTYDRKEISFIEDLNGKLNGMQFIWKDAKYKAPKEFLDTYKEGSVEEVNQDNYLTLLIK
ncbi:MAG: ATP-binding protein, partial [bacterium]